jgi:hypothetical protein
LPGVAGTAGRAAPCTLVVDLPVALQGWHRWRCFPCPSLGSALPAAVPSDGEGRARDNWRSSPALALLSAGRVPMEARDMPG